MKLIKAKIKQKMREAKKLLCVLLGFAKIILRREYVEIPGAQEDLSESENVHAFTVITRSSCVKRFKKEIVYLSCLLRVLTMQHQCCHYTKTEFFNACLTAFLKLSLSILPF